MAIFLFLACFFLLFLNFLYRGHESSSRYRDSLISAGVVQATTLVAITEALSWFHLVSTVPVAVAWTVVDGVLLVFLARQYRQHPLRIAAGHAPTGPLQWGILGMIAFILAIEFLIAVVSPPNNWDSMTYHMSRVMHWIQNGSVEFYATGIPRQIHMAPAAEFAILHLQILIGSDILANMVQWASMVGGVVLVSLIAAEFGGSFLCQLLAALVTATIPMAIVQSTSTQNDLVVSFWCLSIGYYLLRLMRTPSTRNALFAGLSFGLAVLTKGTGIIFAPPLVFCFLVALVKSPTVSWMKALRASFIIALACLCLNGTHWTRNFRLHGSPLGPDRHLHSNVRMTPAIYFSNALRNVTSHVRTPSRRVNIQFWLFARWILGPECENPDSTYVGGEFLLPEFTTHEDFTGNWLHLIAGVIFLVPVFVWAIRCRGPTLTYVMAVLCGGLLFPFVLRWQPFATRLHLPLFMLSAPLLGIAIGQFLSKKSAVLWAVILFLCSFPWLFQNALRPLLGPDSVLNVDRVTAMFANRPYCKGPHLAVADWIIGHQASSVGLMLEEQEEWEYPLWSLIQARQKELPRMFHVNVKNRSRVLNNETSVPDAIVTCENIESLRLNGARYERVFMWSPLAILAKVTSEE